MFKRAIKHFLFMFFNFKYSVVILCGCIFIGSVLFGQNQSAIVFEQIFLEQGLSQSIVTSICQDDRGFMWFGTEDGLNKYNGYEFTVIRHDPGDTNSLSYNNITALYKDSKGIIWIGTFYGGLNRFNPNTYQLIRYQHYPNNPNSLSHNNINVIFEDKSGNLWIGTDGGLNQLHLGENDESSPVFKHFLNEPQNPNSLSNNIVRSICEDQAGTLWIGTEGGLNELVPGKQAGKKLKELLYRWFSLPSSKPFLLMRV